MTQFAFGVGFPDMTSQQVVSGPNSVAAISSGQFKCLKRDFSVTDGKIYLDIFVSIICRELKTVEG